MSLITDVRRTLNARACFALVDLATALRAGRIAESEILAIGLTAEDVRAGDACVMTGDIDRRTLDADVRASVLPLLRLGATRRDNDPDAVILADSEGRALLTARHLEMARLACEPLSESQARTLQRLFNTPYGLRASAGPAKTDTGPRLL